MGRVDTARLATWHLFAADALSAAAAAHHHPHPCRLRRCLPQVHHAKVGASQITEVATMAVDTAVLATWHTFVVGTHSAAALPCSCPRPRSRPRPRHHHH